MYKKKTEDDKKRKRKKEKQREREDKKICKIYTDYLLLRIFVDEIFCR
jgi:hypothetical protein